MVQFDNQKSRIYFFIAASLSLFVPVPGRFAYALVLVVLLNIQMIAVTLLYHAIKALKLDNLKNVLMVLGLVFVTILYKQLLIFFCPIMALTLGFCIYLPALSTVAIQFFFQKRNDTFVQHLKDSTSKSLGISACAVVFFIIREMLGYSSISFPSFGKVLIMKFPFSFEKNLGGAFFATIPGSLVLIAVLVSVVIFIQNKFRIMSNVFVPENDLSEGVEK